VEFAGAGVDGLDGDLVAEAFQTTDVVAALAADMRCSQYLGPRSWWLASGLVSRAWTMVSMEFPVAAGRSTP
jgi:hypothetical protein